MNFGTLLLCLTCIASTWVVATVTGTERGVPRTGRVTTTSATLPLMLEQCKGDEATNDANFCKGYIMASFDQLSLMKQICPDDVVRMSDIHSTALRYLRGHAEPSDRQPGYLLAAAFREAYGCRGR